MSLEGEMPLRAANGETVEATSSWGYAEGRSGPAGGSIIATSISPEASMIRLQPGYTQHGHLEPTGAQI